MRSKLSLMVLFASAIATLALASSPAHADRLTPVAEKSSVMDVAYARALALGFRLLKHGQDVDVVYTCDRESWTAFSCEIDSRESKTRRSCTRTLRVRLGESGRMSWRWVPPIVCAG